MSTITFIASCGDAIMAMLFGVVFGTYSSIFIAAPLLILFRLRPQATTADEEKPVGGGKAVAT